MGDRDVYDGTNHVKRQLNEEHTRREARDEYGGSD